VNSGWESIKSMMRRSGVSPATLASNTALVTPRRSAKGQSPARQLRKFAAAARIASAVIKGWPEEPDSPLHSGTGADGEAADGGGGCVTVPVAAGAELKLKRERMSKPCPSTGAAVAAVASAAAPRRLIVRTNLAMSFSIPDCCVSRHGEPIWLRDY
jgi:hypothetical protein